LKASHGIAIKKYRFRQAYSSAWRKTVKGRFTVCPTVQRTMTRSSSPLSAKSLLFYRQPPPKVFCHFSLHAFGGPTHLHCFVSGCCEHVLSLGLPFLQHEAGRGRELKANDLVVPLHFLKASTEGNKFFLRDRSSKLGDIGGLHDIYVANTYDAGTVNFVSHR